jgi:hypothetical protein
MSAMATRVITSTVGGQLISADAGSVRFMSINPARLDNVVAEVVLSGSETFATACASAHAAQRGWAAWTPPAPSRSWICGWPGNGMVQRPLVAPLGSSIGAVDARLS